VRGLDDGGTTMIRTLWAAVAATLLTTGAALAAPPAQQCQIDKNREAGKYIECRQKAEARFARTANHDAHGVDLYKCTVKYVKKWQRIERNAGGACPSTGDEGAIQDYLDITSTDIATALAGGTLANHGHLLETGQTGCWNTSGQPISCTGTGQDGELQKGVGRSYVDNGDGTVTDTRTGLTWEKLSDDGSIHDRHDTYDRSNLTAKTAFLNAYGFAGYTDWRLPTIHELQTLVNYATYTPAITAYAFNWGCTPGCTVYTCSCMSNSYRTWSSTVVESDPTRSWTVDFYWGDIKRSEYNNNSIRAVRGGS
jgi:hypothetical protein